MSYPNTNRRVSICEIETLFGEGRERGKRVSALDRVDIGVLTLTLVSMLSLNLSRLGFQSNHVSTRRSTLLNHRSLILFQPDYSRQQVSLPFSRTTRGIHYIVGHLSGEPL